MNVELISFKTKIHFHYIMICPLSPLPLISVATQISALAYDRWHKSQNGTQRVQQRQANI